MIDSRWLAPELQRFVSSRSGEAAGASVPAEEVLYSDSLKAAMVSHSRISRLFRISALVLLAGTALAALAAPVPVGAVPLDPATFEEYIFSPLGDASGTSSLTPEAIVVNATTEGSTVAASVTTAVSPKASISADIQNASTDLSGAVTYQIRLVADDDVSMLGQVVPVLFSFEGGIDVSDILGVQEVNIGYSVIVDGGETRDLNLCFGGSTGCTTTPSLGLNDQFHLALPFFDNQISNTATISFFASGLLTGGAFEAWIGPLLSIDPSIELVRIEFSPGVAVPEPGALALLAFGLIALGGIALKRI